MDMECTSARGAETGALEADDRFSLAVSRVRSGYLPAGQSGAVSAGAGRGELCVLCDRVIGADEVVYEVIGMKCGRSRKCSFHRPCYDAWMMTSPHVL